MPAFGLGTWKSPADEVRQAVKTALELGYCHVDAAWIYQNEQAVGEGISAAIGSGAIARESLFVTSKLWNTFHRPQDVETGCRETLSALGLDYLDLYLMHWPVAFKPQASQHKNPEDFYSLDELPLSQTFEAMLKLREKGLAKSIGVSNFTPSKLQRIITETGVVPSVNQVELHPYNPQNELLAYCQAQGIRLTAYSPLGSGDRPDSMKQKDEPPLLDNETVNAIAQTENLSAAQLLIAWAIDRGTVVIPKSTHASRLAENLAAATHTLSAEARAALDAIDIQYRYVSPSMWFFPGITYQGDSFWC
ncbi:MAG: aldo/keto reductase [Phormidesmis sp. RL_2_1]|nr:aldo/keto reductase [Phormidesmis sp. RL_2_1]